jgi:transposase-like protein
MERDMPRSQSFPFSRRPPFCPAPDCDSHANPVGWRFKKKGFYLRAAAPHRIQRYVCHRCGRNFSSQTFSPTYWLRHPELLRPIFFRSLACSALRQITNEFGVTHATIQRHLERLGRHCLLYHERLRPNEPDEPLVLDGFRTTESGHYWPFELNLLVGRSHYVYGFNEAELRRSGTMRPGQRRKREQLEAACGRPARQATRDAIAELVARVVPMGAQADIHSDEHRAYPVALRAVAGRRIRHTTISSKAARTASNPLFPVNLADLLLRHTGANHKRETIAFSKRRQNACYRAAIWVVWRNYIKSVSERRRDAPPGVKVGVIRAGCSVDDVLRERLFPWRQRMGGWLERCYFGRIPTRAIARCRVHLLTYAV